MKESDGAKKGIASVACAAVVASIAGAVPVIVPAPRERSVTGGEYCFFGESLPLYPLTARGTGG